ncbi:hypothetical protein Barb6_03108 [Bacteroidales bacterium Barb6]|nr:hypothetical protein Barb6_03108 [Bacteroidales bacterium Barb6]
MTKSIFTKVFDSEAYDVPHTARFRWFIRTLEHCLPLYAATGDVINGGRPHHHHRASQQVQRHTPFFERCPDYLNDTDSNRITDLRSGEEVAHINIH